MVAFDLNIDMKFLIATTTAIYTYNLSLLLADTYIITCTLNPYIASVPLFYGLFVEICDLYTFSALQHTLNCCCTLFYTNQQCDIAFIYIHIFWGGSLLKDSV